MNIEITGPEYREIVRISQEVKARLARAAESGELTGLVDVRDNLDRGRPELQVRVDRERAARFGLNTAQIATNVRTAIAGEEVSKYRDGEEEYEIRLRLSEDDRASLEALRNLTIPYEGSQIPLVAVADIEMGGGLGSITRLDLDRVVTVQGDVAAGGNAQELLGRVKAFLAEYEAGLPPGYAMSYTGESEDQEKSFTFLTRAFLIAAGLIFMILVAQFNRIIGPFIIMVAVGLSLIGVLLGLIITRTPFGLMSFIGIISLAGIVVNNNIVLIDYTMQLRERGLEKQAAIVEAGATRLRPVLLTRLDHRAGPHPSRVRAEHRFHRILGVLRPGLSARFAEHPVLGPDGTAIISGLTFATFLTLVIIPVMYSLFDSAAVRLSRYFGRMPAD